MIQRGGYLRAENGWRDKDIVKNLEMSGYGYENFLLYSVSSSDMAGDEPIKG